MNSNDYLLKIENTISVCITISYFLKLNFSSILRILITQVLEL